MLSFNHKKTTIKYLTNLIPLQHYLR